MLTAVTTPCSVFLPSEYMCSKNIIESVIIEIIFRSHAQLGDNWSRLDKVLTSPGVVFTDYRHL